jgi:hypothetical protein
MQFSVGFDVTDTGFRIASQQGSAPTNGAPVSYPSVFYGCHYTNCSPGTVLPKRVSELTSVTSGIDYTYTSGTYDAAYDIWLDPTVAQSGTAVTAKNASYNATIAPGASTSFGFQAEGGGANPAAFSLNGAGCRAA